MELKYEEIWNTIKNNGLYLGKWLGLSLWIGILVGTVLAFFLTCLQWVVKQQSSHFWLLFLLPVGGAFISFLYKKMGKNALAGNNLVIGQANGGKENIPLRLVPLSLLGTLVTHLFGGSAGREGTAMQMGAAIAEFISKQVHLKQIDRKIIIICGVAAGFSSVFGTPLAGTIFALEVLTLGIIHYEALIPSFFSAFFADLVTTSYGVTHIRYAMGAIPSFTIGLFFKLIFAGVLFGITGFVFKHATVLIKKQYAKWMSDPVLRSFVGGLVIIFFVFFIGNREYLGLSTPLLQQAFDGTVATFAFLWKFIFTVLTLGAGFQGGEVTPLFDIGASLGSSIAVLVALPVPFLAALGFIGVFTGATNTPIACFIMGIELFGSDGAAYVFLICVISYLCSGNSGIYASQKMGIQKGALFEEHVINWEWLH